MTELVVISGKGGTGKTTVVASFATLAPNAVLADCDVDASDLHLLLAPVHLREEEFASGHEAVIRQADCIRCGACLAHCRYDAVQNTKGGAGEATFTIDPVSCEGCGVCVTLCPVAAIDFPVRVCGSWFVSRTRFGPMVHAQLGVAAENSGKLVALVRRQARRVSDESARDLILVDGPPGIGCPVIASMTGATAVLVVAEPSVSGRHDIERVLALASHFKMPAALCVNRWDINPAMTEEIERVAAAQGAFVAGRIPYDNSVIRAHIAGLSAVEYGGPAATEIAAVWRNLWTML